MIDKPHQRTYSTRLGLCNAFLLSRLAYSAEKSFEVAEGKVNPIKEAMVQGQGYVMQFCFQD